MKTFLKLGLCAALAALMLGSVYAYMGNPRIIGPDSVISASTVTNRMVDEITLTGQWKYEFTTPPDTEITNQFNPISASAVAKWSVTPALDGSGFSASLGGPYSTNVSHVNPVYFSVLSGGVYTVTLTATSDLFQTEQVNIINITELHADIVTNAVVVAGGTTNIPFPLTPESYGSMSWTLTPELENGAEFASTGDGGATVDAGTLAQRYEVRVEVPALPICWDTATLTVITNFTIVASKLYVCPSNTITATAWTLDANNVPITIAADWTIPEGDTRMEIVGDADGVDTITLRGLAGSDVTNDVKVHAAASDAPTLTDDEWFTVLKVDIEQATTNVYWKLTNAVLNLTEDSFWAEAAGGGVTWSSTPAGLSGSGSGGTYTFNPNASTQGTFVVTARASLLPECQDVCTVCVYRLVSKSFSGTETPDGQYVDLTASGTYDSWLTASIESGDLTPSPASYQGVDSGTYPFDGIAAPRNETLASLDMRVTLQANTNATPPLPYCLAPRSSTDPINTENGDMYLTETDLIVPCPGLNLEWRRMYHSVTTNAVGPLSEYGYQYPSISSESPNLGAGWTHSYNWRVVATNIQYSLPSSAKIVQKMEEDPGYHGEIVEAGTNVYLVDWLVDYDEDGNVIYPPQRTIASIPLREIMYGVSCSCLVLKTWDGADYIFKPEIGNWRYAAAGLNWQLDSTTNGYMLTIPDSQEMYFDNNGYLTRIQDFWSNRVDLTYEGTGTNKHLTRVDHNNGQALAFTYSGQKITGVSATNGLAIAYSYSGSNLVESRSTVGGRDQVTQYAYGPFMTNRINAISNCFRYTYATNSLGDPTPRSSGMQLTDTPTSQSPLYYQHTVQYSNLLWGAFGDTYLCYQRDGIEQSFKYKYNYDRSLKEIYGPLNTNGAGPKTVFSYDGYGNATQITREEVPGESFNEVTIYGPNRNVLSNGVGYCAAPTHWWQTSWDADAKYPTFTLDPDGHRVDYTFTNSRLTRVWNTSGGQTAFDTRFSYNSAGQLAAVTNALGHWVRYEYDAWGNPSKITPQAGPEIFCGFNQLGYMTNLVMPGNRATVFDPDALGRVQSIVWPDGVGESFQYDDLGNLTNHTDRAGRASRLDWLPTRKLSSISRVLNGQTVGMTYDYDQQFNTLKIRDALNRPVESYALDIQDRPVTVSNVEGQVMSVVYGVGNLIKSITRFDGTTVSNAYDGDGRLSSVVYPDDVLSMSYTSSGLLHEAGDAAGTIHCEYDGFNRLAWVSGVVTNSRVDYTYLAAGQMATASSLVGQVSFSYDEAERMTGIACQNSAGITSLVYQLSYNPTNGLLAGVTNVGGMQMGCSYDIIDRLTALTWQNATGSMVRSFGYQHNAVGMITQKVALAAGQSVTNIYGYDALDRLTSEISVGSVTSVVNYSYDLVGNRTQMVANGSTSTYTLGTGNRLVSWGTNGSQQFDAAGNVTNIQYEDGGQLAMSWDSRYRLTSVYTNGGLVENYGYDAMDRRVWISDGTETNYLIYCGATKKVIAEVGADGSLKRSYIYGQGIDNILAMNVYGATTSTYFYVRDHLGSVQVLVDSTGSVVESYQYDVWGNTTVFDGSGNPLTQSAIGNRYCWQGREISWATGLYSFRARWYDPVTGRWLSNDPIGISGGLNQYVFCANNPVNFVDPSGLLTVHIWNYEGGSKGGAWGHASITLDNGTHISWWPQGTGRERSSFSGRIYEVAPFPQEQQQLRDDIRREDNHQPNKDITITGLDEAAIQKWWDTFRTGNKWKTLSQNCSTTAAEALKAGGADVRWRDIFKAHNMVWTPADVEEFANAINRYLGDQPKKNNCP